MLDLKKLNLWQCDSCRGWAAGQLPRLNRDCRHLCFEAAMVRSLDHRASLGLAMGKGKAMDKLPQHAERQKPQRNLTTTGLDFAWIVDWACTNLALARTT